MEGTPMKISTQTLLGSLAITLLAGTAAAQTQPGPATPGQSTAAGAYMTSPGAAPSVSDNSRLAALIPDGMSSQTVCDQFKSLQLCAATLHAAQNLNIPFTDLKRKVAGGEGLSAAIHTLKPEADANAEARRAKNQAMSDFSG
jgi:hypothetical protein